MHAAPATIALDLYAEGLFQQSESVGISVGGPVAPDYTLAITALQKAIEIEPKQPANWANLAQAYVQQARYKTGADFDGPMEKALAAYRKSIDLRPDDPTTHGNYGLALAMVKKYAEADVEVKKANRLDSNGAYSRFFNLAVALNINGAASEARTAFQEAIDAAPNDPKNAESYYQYGNILVAQAKPENGHFVILPGTIEAFQQYLHLAPAGPNARSCKAMIAMLGNL
jgi:tetratricopeptide (TPR) repeat protein